MKLRIITGYGKNRKINDIDNVSNIFTNEETGGTYLYVYIYTNEQHTICKKKFICLEDCCAVYLLPF